MIIGIAMAASEKGSPLGVATAYRAGSLFDKGVNTVAFGLLAIPNFVLGLVLAYYVGVKLNWVDPTGYIDFGAF